MLVNEVRISPIMPNICRHALVGLGLALGVAACGGSESDDNSTGSGNSSSSSSDGEWQPPAPCLDVYPDAIKIDIPSSGRRYHARGDYLYISAVNDLYRVPINGGAAETIYSSESESWEVLFTKDKIVWNHHNKEIVLLDYEGVPLSTIEGFSKPFDAYDRSMNLAVSKTDGDSYHTLDLATAEVTEYVFDEPFTIGARYHHEAGDGYYWVGDYSEEGAWRIRIGTTDAEQVAVGGFSYIRDGLIFAYPAGTLGSNLTAAPVDADFSNSDVFEVVVNSANGNVGAGFDRILRDTQGALYGTRSVGNETNLIMGFDAGAPTYAVLTELPQNCYIRDFLDIDGRVNVVIVPASLEPSEVYRLPL